MADIELIVRIDEHTYREALTHGGNSGKLVVAVRNGTPLNDVLGKIRAEIEQNAYPIVHGVNNHEKGMTLYGILQVIDKYRETESEEV